MVVAGIGDQRDTLTSRSIVIGLRRKLPTETVERLPSDLFERLLDLRRRAARWAADNGITIGAMEMEPPPCGDDRRRDNFGPLYRLAHVLGGRLAGPCRRRVSRRGRGPRRRRGRGGEACCGMQASSRSPMPSARSGTPPSVPSSACLGGSSTSTTRWQHH